MKKNKLTTNYHTHSYRCGHAHGTDEEYVKLALANGFTELGFTDHIFYPGLRQDGIRQKDSDYQDYVNSISLLREKYKDKIKIFIGYESEYQSSSLKFLNNLKKEGKIQYFILGNHCYFDKDNNFVWYNSFKNDKLHAKMYFDNTIAGMETGLFSYVAHPDIILNSYKVEDDFINAQILRLIKASIKLNCPLEINLAGARRHLQCGTTIEQCDEVYYPYARFWKMVGDMGAPVIIGVDAHDPYEFECNAYKVAENYIKRFNLKVINKLTIV